MLAELFGGVVLTVLAVACGLFVLVAIVVALIYNGLVGKKNMCENSFATIDVMLKKRYDLIPNLVAAVKGYMTHENEVFTKITELRAKAISGNLSTEEKIGVNNQITSALRSIMVSVENYPELKASENFLHLQTTLTELEEQISAARRAYNSAVLDYNNACEMIPTNFVASIIGYGRKSFFEAGDGERSRVDVGFSAKK